MKQLYLENNLAIIKIFWILLHFFNTIEICFRHKIFRNETRSKQYTITKFPLHKQKSWFCCNIEHSTDILFPNKRFLFPDHFLNCSDDCPQSQCGITASDYLKLWNKKAISVAYLKDSFCMYLELKITVSVAFVLHAVGIAEFKKTVCICVGGEIFGTDNVFSLSTKRWMETCIASIRIDTWCTINVALQECNRFDILSYTLIELQYHNTKYLWK